MIPSRHDRLCEELEELAVRLSVSVLERAECTVVFRFPDEGVPDVVLTTETPAQLALAARAVGARRVALLKAEGQAKEYRNGDA